MDIDTLYLDCQLASFVDNGQPYGQVLDGALAVQGGLIVFAGPRAELPDGLRPRLTRKLEGAWISPGLIDCHTHAVFGGNRADEYAQRLAGASYAQIAAAGGGILGTVRKTREASLEQLTASASWRLRQLAADGVTTVEIKSGYGLDLDSERRMLQAACAAATATGMSVRTTLLGLHALPVEARVSESARRAFVDQVCESWLPQLVAEGLVDAVDAFCEGIAFSPDECSRLFQAAQALGVPVKLHADQLSDGGGAALAAQFGGLSADHVEYTGAEAVQAMAKAGTVAVLLPAAFLVLGETRKPPIAEFRRTGVRMALASDLNPGTSPQLSLRLAANLGCCLFGLTPEEALAGITRNAAAALGLTDRGVLAAGKRADLAIWRLGHIEELCYWLGGTLLEERVLA